MQTLRIASVVFFGMAFLSLHPTRASTVKRTCIAGYFVQYHVSKLAHGAKANEKTYESDDVTATGLAGVVAGHSIKCKAYKRACKNAIDQMFSTLTYAGVRNALCTELKKIKHTGFFRIERVYASAKTTNPKAVETCGIDYKKTSKELVLSSVEKKWQRCQSPLRTKARCDQKKLKGWTTAIKAHGELLQRAIMGKKPAQISKALRLLNRDGKRAKTHLEKCTK